MSTLKKPVPFGKYYLLERINVGGMAEVFKAKTFGVEGFERLLAVKRILPNIAEDEEFITMFIDEAKIAVQLQHANIAQIFDLGKVDDSYFIALEYVNGRDLRSIFDRHAQPRRGAADRAGLLRHDAGLRGARLRAQQARRAGAASCTSSTATSRRRTCSSAYDGEVKLIDFGIAKAAGKASTTQAGILKGKFGYMSPEQVRGLPIDKRSDIFAVGIVLYELLTGERLFVGETDFSTLEKVRNVEIVPPSSYNKKIPQELERLMMKALARDPEDRYSNAIDLHDDLQSFLYSIGEFYSRKDLAGWMKKTFAAEIEEDNAKIRAVPADRGAGRRLERGLAPGGRGRGAGSRIGAAPRRRSARAPASRRTRTSRRRWGGTTRSSTPRSSTRPTRTRRQDRRAERGRSLLRGRRPHGGQRAAARHPRAGAPARGAGDAEAATKADRADQAGVRRDSASRRRRSRAPSRPCRAGRR